MKEKSFKFIFIDYIYFFYLFFYFNSRMEEAKNSNFLPEIKPELLELIMNQPPDQEAPVSDLVEVGWDIIETVRDKVNNI